MTVNEIRSRLLKAGMKHNCSHLLLGFSCEKKQGHIYDPSTHSVLSLLPRQTGTYSGFPLHEYCYLSTAFSQYLRYLDAQHILLREYQPELIEVDAEDGAGDEKPNEMLETIWEYSVKQLIVPKPDETGPADNTVGFVFLNNHLYSTTSIEVIEY
jgi:hypothetical protein